MNVYKKCIKPILFLQDPEVVHDRFTCLGVWLGKHRITKKITRLLFHYRNKKLQQSIHGINFENPVGLAAGFDYNVKLPSIIGDVGFGFVSCGTVTYGNYAGNAQPRLKRLPKSQSLLVNKGFKSDGLKNVLDTVLFTDVNPVPIGLSIGATNSPDTCQSDDQVADIVCSFKYALSHEKSDNFSYYELNISCPNVLGSGALTEPSVLESVLQQVTELPLDKPLFVKFPLEIDWEHAKELVQIMVRYSVDAVIVANLLKHKGNFDFDTDEMQEIIDNKQQGNFSGKSTQKISDELIGKIYQEFGDDITIVGVGGIFSAEDAYEKIKQGASLVQLITGMIFEGPQLIGNINRGLIKLMQRDGYTYVREVIGVYHR